MKSGNWIPVDKRLINLLPRDREYTFIEAYISYRVDIENGEENSINGYSRIWSWSRNKVRHFVEGLRTGKGHVMDNQRTGKGQEVRLIFNNLQDDKDNQGTVEGQSRDRQGTTTIIINKNKNIKKTPALKNPYAENVLMTSAEYEKLTLNYGQPQAVWMIEKLSTYKKSSGKKYKCDYSAILTWVVSEAEKSFKSTPPVQVFGYVFDRDPKPETGTPEYKIWKEKTAAKYN